MILRINNIDPVQINLPTFVCFMWRHLEWFAGLAEAILLGLLGYVTAKYPEAGFPIGLALLFVNRTARYVKRQPPPQLVDVPTLRPPTG